MAYEYCCVCDEETGRAGIGDDSIYCEALKVSDSRFMSGKLICGSVGDYVGPLCFPCYEKMREAGLFEETK